MNIITLIQTALTALNSNAEVFLLSEPRAQNEELEHTGTAIIVYPDWDSENRLTQGLEITEIRRYNIDFKTPDEWDNSDNNSSTSYNSITSVDRIEEMNTLANSVFMWIAAKADEFPYLNKMPSWRKPSPILRAGNGTMSGVNVKLTLDIKGDYKCNYLEPLRVIGKQPVEAPEYQTNNKATTFTVGAIGADYTDLAVAYAAASAGDVIELIDSSITMTSNLVFNKELDGEGNSIKIKGVPTKTTLNLNTSFVSCQVTGALQASIEFENIVYSDAGSTYAFQSKASATDGFVHFINCDIDISSRMYFYDCKEAVFDGCNFTMGSASPPLNYKATALSVADTRLVVNNCTINNPALPTFLYMVSDPTNLNEIVITNSDLRVQEQIISFSRYINNYRIEGNYLKSEISAGVSFGWEWDAVPTVFTEWDIVTPYLENDIRYYNFNLWQAVSANTGNEPSQASTFWKPAELFTGSIKYNTIMRDNYIASGHGVFLGFGSYNTELSNNIIARFWFNCVVKGVNNTINYNGIGEGAAGISIFANNQSSVNNNTIRVDEDESIEYGPQGNGVIYGEGPQKTPYLNNIVSHNGVGEALLCDLSGRWAVFPGDTNTFNNNVWYGVGSVVRYNMSTYNMFNAISFNNFKDDCRDANAEYLDPKFIGSDPTDPDYYMPSNNYFKDKDIGAL